LAAERYVCLQQRDLTLGERNEFLRQRDIAIGERNEFLRHGICDRIKNVQADRLYRHMHRSNARPRLSCQSVVGPCTGTRGCDPNQMR
jgi:hypothetical protein